MTTVSTLVLRSPGTNCDEETAYAFQLAGSGTELVHIRRLVATPHPLSDFQIMVLPGGFAYGDDLGAGKVVANEISLKLNEEIDSFVRRGGLVMGICNGFQILVKAGLLPGPLASGQKVTLTANDCGRFECRWINLKVNPGSRCVFTTGIERISLPVAHGEGKLVAPAETLAELDAAMYYCDVEGRETADYPDNPNGSMGNIAGLTDATGRIFALMPHPERYVRATQHPRWTAGSAHDPGDGLRIFKNAVNWVKNL